MHLETDDEDYTCMRAADKAADMLSGGFVVAAVLRVKGSYAQQNGTS